MKLLRLKINSPFSSLSEGFEINFRSPFESERASSNDWLEFHPFCLVGRNGSGKSNVLEALANIFFHLESCSNINQPENFTENFSSKVSNPDAYELEYYINPTKMKSRTMIKVSIKKTENEDPTMTYTEYPYNKKKPVKVAVVANEFDNFPAPGKNYLPDLIVGYSSGENEILSIPFLKSRILQYDEYEYFLENKFKYQEPENNLIYIDYEMSQSVLLANFLFQEPEVLEPLKEELKIKDIKRFRMTLNLHKVNEIPVLTELVNQLQSFKKCATAIYNDGKNLILDFWINETTKEAFKKNFKDIFRLFRAFQILYTLNYRTLKESTKSEVYKSKGYYTEGKIPVPERPEKVFYFEKYFIEKQLGDEETTVELLLKNLSDGEQQFLHSLGICLMLGNKSALLLLDEPETHFNPDWRSKFISILKRSLDLSKSENLMRDVLITTHSPFIISDCLANKVFYFKKDKETNFKAECINAQEMDFKTFGTSVDIIVDVLFGKSQTIGDLSRSKLQFDLNQIKDKQDVINLKEKISYLGDSLEKDLLLATLNGFKFD